MTNHEIDNSFRRIRNYVHRFLVIVGAVGLSLVFFLVLPLMQSLTTSPKNDLIVQSIDTAQLEAPPPPPQEEPEKEEDQEETPPQLTEEAPPLDLSQLELALNPGLSNGFLNGDFTMKINAIGGKSEQMDSLFSIADLDQRPRAIYQPSPRMTQNIIKKTPGTVYIIFIVDQDGRVVDPKVQKSTDAIFEQPALSAIKQWKFEPGKRNGSAVRFRMRVPITFPKGS